jgi:hypothetical protein
LVKGALIATLRQYRSDRLDVEAEQQTRESKTGREEGVDVMVRM